MATTNDEKKVMISTSQAAGLILSRPRVEKIMRKYMKCNRLSQDSIIGMAAVLETVARWLIRSAHESAKKEKRKKIVSRYLMKGIATNVDLLSLLGNVRIAGSGVMPTPPDPIKPSSGKKRKKPATEKPKKAIVVKKAAVSKKTTTTTNKRKKQKRLR